MDSKSLVLSSIYKSRDFTLSRRPSLDTKSCIEFFPERPVENFQETSAMPEKNLDPRIRVYLEKLNAASDRVNDIESMLESLRGRHRQLIQEGIKKLKATLSRDGMRATLKKADPYYLTVKERDKVSSEVGLLAQQYKKASDALLKAQTESWSYEKSLYSEKSLGASVKVDPEKQEQLNNLNLKVEECQENKLKAERAYKNGLAKVESLRLKEDYHLANLGCN
jgi:hypothetical protein